MGKLKLNINELKVESFEINRSTKQVGTVKGNKDDCTSTSNIDTISVFTEDCQPTELQQTCALSCGGSCMYTCAHTCDPDLSKVYCLMTDDCNNTRIL